jgi:hypothetical protein
MTPIPNTVIVAVLLIALVIGAAAWFVMQKQRSLKQKQRFGPEYDLMVSEFGSPYSPPNLISKSLTTRLTPGIRLLMRIAFRKSQSSNTIPCKVAIPFRMVTDTCSLKK